MVRLTVLLAASLLLASPTSGVDVSTTSYVIAPSCCGSTDVRVVNSISVDNPEPYWSNQPYSLLYLATTFDCDGTYNNLHENCCIGQGNSSVIRSYFNGATCPIQAKGRALGWIGGGSLPYHEHESESACAQPCYTCAPPGEDCDYWSDPFCDDPWGPH